MPSSRPSRNSGFVGHKDDDSATNTAASPRPSRSRSRSVSREESKSSSQEQPTRSTPKSTTKKKKMRKNTMALSYPLVAALPSVSGSTDETTMKYCNVRIFVQGREYIPGVKTGFTNSSNKKKSNRMLSVDISPHKNINNTPQKNAPAMPLLTLPAPVAEDGNHYYCAVCKTVGDVVCCDGCPKVFHRNCVPLGKAKQNLLQDVDPWYCPDCIEMKQNEDDDKKPAAEEMKDAPPLEAPDLPQEEQQPSAAGDDAIMEDVPADTAKVAATIKPAAPATTTKTTATTKEEQQSPKPTPRSSPRQPPKPSKESSLPLTAAAPILPTRSSKRKRSMDEAASKKKTKQEHGGDGDYHDGVELKMYDDDTPTSPRLKKRAKTTDAVTTSGKSSPKPTTAATPSKKSKDKKDKKKKKKKKKHRDDDDNGGDASPTPTAASTAASRSPPPFSTHGGSNDGNDDNTNADDDDDPFQGLFSSVTTGIIQATPAFYFFLAENRLKIERSLIRKHRTFNRLPKGMERNELIAKEGAHWWIKLPFLEQSKYIKESMKDFEKRVVEWKEEKTIAQMTNSTTATATTNDPTFMEDASGGGDHTADLKEDAKLTYQNHQQLYLNTTVGSKPFKPDPRESNNKILLELLQDMRFHPLPMMDSERDINKEYGGLDADKVSIPHFDVHGPVSTSIGDECLGCQRGFAHFCNVLKRHVPAVLNRARLQPPLSSLMATRVGLGFKEEPPKEAVNESLQQAKNAQVFSVRDVPAISSAKALPEIPYESLDDPSNRGDDIVRFIEEVVHMKVPEPHRPTTPTNRNASAAQQAAAAASTPASVVRTSRAALPIRKTAKLPTNDPATPILEEEDVDGVTVIRKCGRCRTVIDGDQGCNQCRRAQLVINLSRQGVEKDSGNGESSLQQAADKLKTSTIMHSRIHMKDFVPQLQSEGDEAIANHIIRSRWNPYAIMPPTKVTAPVYDPSKPKAEEMDDSSDGEISSEESSSDSSMEIESSMIARRASHPAMVAKRRVIEKETDDDDDTDDGSPDAKRPRMSARMKAKERASIASASSYLRDGDIASYLRDGDIDSQDLDATARQALLKRFSKEKEELNRKCLSVSCCGLLLGMMRRDPLQLFARPVEADGYRQIIKYPMDFGLIKRKLLRGKYGSFSSFLFDAQLLCDNALIYNPPDSVYSKTAKELSDVLNVMKKRSLKWMAAIKDAHSKAFKSAPKAELVDAYERMDKLSTNSFMIMDSFRELRKTWPEAVEMLKSHDRLRKSVESDFMRTKENETAYYGNIAIRRVASAAAHSLAPYPDSSGIYNIVGKRSHTEDEQLREYIAQRVGQSVENPQLKDIPMWREDMIMRVLRKAQSRRMEGMTESPSGCARCDGVRQDNPQDVLKSVAKSVRWGRFARKNEAAGNPRIDKSRLGLSTGLGSKAMQDKLLKHREYNHVHHDDLVAAQPEALVAALERLDDVAVSVGPSRVHGMGLFADQPFKKGDVVAEYIGEYVSSAVTDAREKIYREERIQDYQFRVGSDLVIDATKRGGHARYINHSCDPNCTSKIVPGVREGLKRVVVTASRDISPMEEFSYDYQFPLEKDLEARIPCNCHSELCRGFMNWDLPEKGSSNQDFRSTKRGANMRDRIRRLGRPLKGGESSSAKEKGGGGEEKAESMAL